MGAKISKHHKKYNHKRDKICTFQFVLTIVLILYLYCCMTIAKTSYKLPLEDAKRGLSMLNEYGLAKINFAGGEPFLIDQGRYLGELVKYCKEDLKISMVSVVTNGSKVTQKWFKNYGKYLDMLAMSIDSFNNDMNIKIGRCTNTKNPKPTRPQTMVLEQVSTLCKQYNVLFKINTVVNTYNWDEDMTKYIKKYNPMRWKVFQCLLIEGENCTDNSNVGEKVLRDGREFVVSDEKFEHFLETHKEIECLVPENNTTMRNSYVILDEYMRFLDCSENKKTPSRSLLDVGVENALNAANFDEIMFLKRGGKYEFSKPRNSLEW